MIDTTINQKSLKTVADSHNRKRDLEDSLHYFLLRAKEAAEKGDYEATLCFSPLDEEFYKNSLTNLGFYVKTRQETYHHCSFTVFDVMYLVAWEYEQTIFVVRPEYTK